MSVNARFCASAQTLMRAGFYADVDLVLFESHFECSVKLFKHFLHRPEHNPQGKLINKQQRIIQDLNT